MSSLQNADIGYGITAEQEAKWGVALEHVAELLNLEAGWDGADAPKIRQDLILSATQLVIQLKNEGEWPAPHDIYPLSEGTIILEWQLPGQIIVRIEVEEVGKGERMITYPDQPTEFSSKTWSPSEAPSQYRGTSPYFEAVSQVTIIVSDMDDAVSFCGGFSLAA